MALGAKTLPMALAALFVVFLTFEFVIVAALSLSTEVVPGVRATMISSFFAAAGIGRVVGALVGGQVWMTGGIRAIGVVFVLVSGLALVSLVWGCGVGGPRQRALETKLEIWHNMQNALAF